MHSYYGNGACTSLIRLPGHSRLPSRFMQVQPHGYVGYVSKPVVIIACTVQTRKSRKPDRPPTNRGGRGRAGIRGYRKMRGSDKYKRKQEMAILDVDGQMGLRVPRWAIS